MTPSERQELATCLKRASEILYNNSDPESLETFEGIEKTVREQVLENVSPQIAFFYRQQDRNKERKKKNGKKLCRENSNHEKTSRKVRNRAIYSP